MEAWAAMKAILQSRSRMITMDLGSKLQKVKLEEAGDAHAHFRGLTNLREELASMGKTLDDAGFTLILLNSLPASYKAIISVINATANCTGNPVTPEQVMGLVTNEYDRRVIKTGKKSSEEAPATKSQRHNKHRRSIKCYKCQKKGHYKADCCTDKKSRRPPRKNKISIGNDTDNQNARM